MIEPPSEVGTAHDTNAEVSPSARTLKSLTAAGTVAGIPQAIVVLDSIAVEFAVVIATTLTSYVVPLVNPVAE
jgi:hypothetical protein